MPMLSAHILCRLKAGLRRRMSVRRFRRDEKGTTAIEFGLVAAPFFALLFAVIETAFVFFAGQALEIAVADSSRLIMTGQAQSQNFSEQQFKNAVCSRLSAMFDCQGNIHIDVRSYSGFGGVNMSKPINDQGELVQDFTYNPGNAEDIVVVRVMYEWPLRVPMLGLNLADLSNGKRLLMATAAFRNEPY
jgi:Flp pilus assembly protein TadG